jgi:excisionase family DNA binding protein
VLTVREAAAGIGLTQWAIYRVIQRGELTAYKPCGRLRIHEADLDAWLEGGFTRSSQRLDESRWRWAGLLAG